MRNFVVAVFIGLLGLNAFAGVSICTVTLSGRYALSYYIETQDCTGGKSLAFSATEKLGNLAQANSHVTREAVGQGWKATSSFLSSRYLYLVFQYDDPAAGS